MKIFKNLGSYNFCNSSEKQWNLSMQFPSGSAHSSISVLFPEDDEPEIDMLPPSEVISIIEKRVKSFWISSSRKGDLEIVAWVLENYIELDAAWAESQVAAKRRQIENLEKQIKEMDCYIEERQLQLSSK